MSVPVDWMAIFIGTVSSVILGMIWYGPLFGKKWMELAGIVMPTEKPSCKMMIKPIVISLVGAFFMSYTLSFNIAFGNAYLGTSGMMAGLMASFWNWLGFVVPVLLSFVAWEGKSWKLWAIHAGYWLVLLAVMGKVISLLA